MRTAGDMGRGFLLRDACKLVYAVWPVKLVGLRRSLAGGVYVCGRLRNATESTAYPDTVPDISRKGGLRESFKFNHLRAEIGFPPSPPIFLLPVQMVTSRLNPASLAPFACDGLPGCTPRFRHQDWIVSLLSRCWSQLLDLSWQFLGGSAPNAVRISFQGVTRKWT
jgi:hypothetical protein